MYARTARLAPHTSQRARCMRHPMCVPAVTPADAVLCGGSLLVVLRRSVALAPHTSFAAANAMYAPPSPGNSDISSKWGGPGRRFSPIPAGVGLSRNRCRDASELFSLSLLWVSKIVQFGRSVAEVKSNGRFKQETQRPLAGD